MQDFINPKSMLTPGVAGALMMFLANGIGYVFPEIPNRYLGLLLSFLIGAVVWFSQTNGSYPIFQKLAYWFLNSLVIFVIGFGANHLGLEASGGTSKNGMSQSFVSTAFAQNAPNQGVASPPSKEQGQSPANDQRQLLEQLERQKAENERLRKQLESVQQREAVGATQSGQERRFFRPW